MWLAGDHGSSCKPFLTPTYFWQMKFYYVPNRILETLSFSGEISLSPPQESTLNVDLDFKQPFLELNRILEALHEQDLGPALE